MPSRLPLERVHGPSQAHVTLAAAEVSHKEVIGTGRMSRSCRPDKSIALVKAGSVHSTMTLICRRQTPVPTQWPNKSF